MAARKAIESARFIERVYSATGGTLNPLAGKDGCPGILVLADVDPNEAHRS